MKRCFIILLLSGFNTVYGQTSIVNHNYWLSGGVGLYGSGQYFGISLYSSLNWSRTKLIYRDTITHHKTTFLEFRLIKNIASQNENTYENLTELGLLYGRSFGEGAQFRIQGGIALLTGSIGSGRYTFNSFHQPVYYNENVFVPGIPIEIGIRLVPSKYFAAGLAGFANLNSKASLVGGTLTLDLGRLNSGTRTPATKHKSFDQENKKSDAASGTDHESIIMEHKTSIGLRITYPFSYGLTIKRFTDWNRAIEGSLSVCKYYEYNRFYSLTVLFEKDHESSLYSGFRWFWGGGFHVGYGSETINTGYMVFKRDLLLIGPDGILGIDYSLDKIPFMFSMGINPGIDLIFHPWVSGVMSIRYEF